MKYMLLIYGKEADWTPQQHEECLRESLLICEELRSQGKLDAASPLRPISTATSIRIRNGQRQITDGPFAETAEQLGGFYLLDVENLDEAIAVASRIPPVHKGTVEIRPMPTMPDPVAPAGMRPPRNRICLWFDGKAEEAARFYAATFPDSSVATVFRAPGDYPAGKQGDALTVEFTVLGIPCLGLNGGPQFKHSEAFSFQVATTTQEETDRYWNAIVGNGGEESECGWCRDKWGISWQIIPRALSHALAHPDPAASKRAFEAMMTMRRIDIAAIEAAVRGEAAG